MALTFATRLNEIMNIGGSPRPANLTTIETTINTLHTDIDAAAEVPDESVALAEDMLLKIAEHVGIEFRN